MNRNFTSLLKNKYIMVTLAFIVWVGFFDRNDMITQWHLRSSLRDLRHKKQYYIQQVAQTELESHELLSSPEKLQKFAREKYLMKKDNEDLFVVEDSSQAPPK